MYWGPSVFFILTGKLFQYADLIMDKAFARKFSLKAALAA